MGVGWWWGWLTMLVDLVGLLSLLRVLPSFPLCPSLVPFYLDKERQRINPQRTHQNTNKTPKKIIFLFVVIA